MLSVADAYPADAVGGADLITGAAVRRIVDDNGSTRTARNERIIVTDRTFDFEDPIDGRVCLSETTVREMAGMLGMVTAPYVERVEGDLRAAQRRAAEAEQAYAELAAVLDTIKVTRVTIYVAHDGTEHPTRAALEAYHASQVAMPPREIELPTDQEVPQ